MIHAAGLTPASFALLLPDLLRQRAGARAFVLVANDSAADSFWRDLETLRAWRPTAWAGLRPIFLPGWEQSPYRNLQPSPSARFDRIHATATIAHGTGQWVAVASVSSFLQRTPRADFLLESFALGPGLTLPPEQLCQRLDRFGYFRADAVEDRGTYSLRGGILDLFPPNSDQPLRAEFFDETIESVRIFNAETQRSVRSLESGETLTINPAREFPCDPESLALARERLKDWSDQQDYPRNARERVSSLLSQGIVIPEMDYLLPFFQPGPAWITDLAGPDCTIFLLEPEAVRAAAESLGQTDQDLFTASKARQGLTPEPASLRLTLPAALAAFPAPVEVRELAMGEAPLRSHRIRIAAKGKQAEVDALAKEQRSLADNGTHTVLVANSQSQLDRLQFLLSHHQIRSAPAQTEADLPADPSVVSLTLGALSGSFHLPEKKVAFLSEDEIFGEKQHGARPRRKGTGTPVAMDDLSVGDLVVHATHGIAKYQGLTRVTALGSENDFALLEYADGDKLYVPVYRLDMLSRYIGAAGASPSSLDKLGSGSFAKTKEKVQGAIRDIAQDLLRVQAERTTRPGHAFGSPDDEYRRFEAEFPYDETPDQAKAIEDTLDDMCLPRAMDRLICGDVGFGKTEVAIRAAFKAAQDGKQVAVLVPTTILAEQHYLTFSQRMANYPMKLASISRFKSRREQSAVLEDLACGKIDIVIGTHRLLSADVKFKDLGLLVIDEEQRFGVEHKEKLKSLRATTDVLTLTATPIPRTLQMSLMGLKDVSIIRTPPGDRLSIKTSLAPFDEEVIQSAVRTELGRGGQVFFIHNRVQTIGKIAELLQRIVPEAKAVVAHGQMPETQLERAMIGFYQKQFDVLIATAIIENGLDVPNANTLIVNRADAFGLSQLYQIRGRVGRSQARAFAYFLVPETAVITDEARERLAVLQRFVELGSGYSIATHDLELRGGGDVLGQAQSGHIASVGYEMYLEMLQEEIHKLKGGEAAKPREEVEINLPFAAVLPPEYVPDMKARLTLYRRLSAVSTEEEAEQARQELADRYGPLPRPALELLWVVRLKVLLSRMGLKSLALGPKGVSLTAGADPLLSPTMLIQMMHSRPQEFALLPDGKLLIRGHFRTSQELYDKLRQLLSSATQ